MPNSRILLGRRLRDARTNANINQVALAEALGLQQSQISRIESGRRAASVDVVGRWLDHTGGADSARRTEILDLAEAVNSDAATSTWTGLRSEGWGPHQKRYDDLIKASLATFAYQNDLIPGLLQTPAYVEYLMREVICKPADQVADAVSSRLARQQILFESSTRFHVVITESVLRQPFGGRALMVEQLEKLVNLAGLRTVDLAVLPVDTDMPQTWGTHFILYEMPDPEESVVTVELEIRELMETGQKCATVYRNLFDFYRRYSLVGDDAIRFIQQLAVSHRNAIVTPSS